MTISILATVIRAIWFFAEMLHAARHKVTPNKDWDRSSLKILKAAILAVPVGAVMGFTDVGHIQTAGNFLGSAGLALMLAGICIRWVAIRTLGRYFTRTVTVFDDHRIIRNGLYRYLRHPSYTGYLLENLGFGLAFSNWLSALIIFTPIAAAVFYRIHVEERALLQNFSNEYLEYAASTKRLIPMVY
jgi:protein-S-isoprenylcysteine O-methyltransferase Ste14